MMIAMNTQERRQTERERGWVKGEIDDDDDDDDADGTSSSNRGVRGDTGESPPFSD